MAAPGRGRLPAAGFRIDDETVKLIGAGLDQSAPSDSGAILDADLPLRRIAVGYPMPLTAGRRALVLD